MAIRSSVQKENRSSEVSSVTSHFGESSDISAPGFDATRFLTSTVEGSLRNNTRIPSRPAIDAGTHAYAKTTIDVFKVILAPTPRLNTAKKIAPAATATMKGNRTLIAYKTYGVTLARVLSASSRFSGGNCSSRFCAFGLLSISLSITARHPTRSVITVVTAIPTKTSRIIGSTQVGRRTMDSKVGFGLNSTPKIRPNELSEPVVAGEVAGEGVSALAMLVSSWSDRSDQRYGSLSHYGWPEQKFQSEATV